MNSYEILYLVPSLKSEELAKIQEKVKKIIQEKKGKIQEEKSLGLRDLAYPIKHHLKGYYYWLCFDFEPSFLKELEKTLKLESQILRFLIVKHIKPKEKKKITRPKFITKKLEKKEVLKEKPKKEKKVTLEELDQKLEEILEDDIMKEV